MSLKWFVTGLMWIKSVTEFPFFCCYLNPYTMFLSILYPLTLCMWFQYMRPCPIIDHLRYDSSGQFGMTIIQSNFSFCSALVSVQPALLYTIEGITQAGHI